ncbi:MAG: hypothetical protein IKV80_09995 [Bacteroidales bacterium]|nr:hypothetical protein [Bacteroidales bacterium]
MKKYFAIVIALMALSFTQCKPAPTPEGNDGGETRKVKVTCEIPINNTRSDFSNLLKDGKVYWSNGTEYVYLAVHGDTPQLIELKHEGVEGNPNVLSFEGEVKAGLIKEGETYDVWYFGHSHQNTETEKTTYTFGENKIKGSIKNQSGRLGTFGYNHIAKTSVYPTLTSSGENVILSLAGKFEHQIAIVLMDLENVKELYGDAIIGTDYVLAYNDGSDKFELNVTKDEHAKITVEPAPGTSYIALFPNAIVDSEMRYRENKSENDVDYTVYECIIYDEIRASNLYYHPAKDGSKQPLPWAVISSGDVGHKDENGKLLHYHHYVDLGLPSGTLWATKNIGADTMYAYGDYFSWGEIETKETYTRENYAYCEYDYYDEEYGDVYKYESLGDISGNSEYDAATAIWGEEWRMPTHVEMEELYKCCNFTPMKSLNGTNGYMFTGPNGNYIFMPAAGYRDNEFQGHQAGNYYGHYWSSSPAEWGAEAKLFHFDKGYTLCPWYARRYYGCTIRPVLVKKRANLENGQNQNGSNQGGR